MLQRLLGVALGALATLVVLWIGDLANQPERMPWYLAAVVIGAIVSFFWPLLATFWFGQRAKDRRERGIEREVQRQLAEERTRQDD